MTGNELEDTSYKLVNSFHLLANECLTYWLFLVASSYFLFTKNAHFSTSPNARKENDATTGVNYLDRESYLNSLLNLEEEDSEWLSDSNPYECDSSFSDIDTPSPSFWHSLLGLEEKENLLISSSKFKLECDPDHGFATPSYKKNWGIEILLENSELALDDAEDEPLFWPYEGKFNWESEEPWTSFSTSPRRKSLVFHESTKSMTTIKGCEEECDGVNFEASRLSAWSKSSAKKGASECVGKTLVVDVSFDSYEEIPLELEEYFGLDKEVTIEILVGLEEFDGHEGLGLDSEFNCGIFLMDESIR